MEMENNIVAAKSKIFAIRIIKFYQYLCENKREYVISKQLLRSGTSVGANVRESKNAQSGADFVNKLNIALKEADETSYWLELLYESDIISEVEYNSLYGDCSELIKLLVPIIKKLKQKSNLSK